ncbi:MAG: prepilin-type N-terminal cleavage/methylation domain-containing protein [Phycisphaerales bacterium]|nr:prepilin-type N-terminal cleavage/methylation domain-containing protein [Phycisphaerales bacterium]
MNAPRVIRRGFTLIEAVIVVVVIAIAIPPTLLWFDSAVSRRADAVSTLRATTLATLVLEHIIADVNSDAAGLGYAALASPATYLDTPGTGLRARLSSATGMYQSMGLSYQVTIGAPTDYRGVVTGTGADLFRRVTVTITIPRADGAPVAMPVSAMVAAP